MYSDPIERYFSETILDVVDSVIETPINSSFFELVRGARLLKMPSLDSIKKLGDAAYYFQDGDNNPDGDMWLAPVRIFNSSEIATALAAGGEIVDGYEFDYPRSVVRDADVSCDIAGQIKYHEWCAYNVAKVGFALRREVAETIWSASIALASEDQD